jgi:prophage maintenance system killer protein
MHLTFKTTDKETQKKIGQRTRMSSQGTQPVRRFKKTDYSAAYDISLTVIRKIISKHVNAQKLLNSNS